MAANPSSDMSVGDTMPVQLPAFAFVPVHATLGEALSRLDEAGADVALVVAAPVPQRHQIQGVVSRLQIEARGRCDSGLTSL